MSTSASAQLPRVHSQVRLFVDASAGYVPAAKKGAIGFTVAIVSHLGRCRVGSGGGAASRGPGLHARKGAGNFLKGATPSQDMMGEFVGIARVAIGLMWRGVDVAGTKSSKRAFFTKQSALPDVSSQPASSRASAGGRQPEAASTRTGGGSRLLPGLPRKIGWGKGCVIKPDGAAHIT